MKAVKNWTLWGVIGMVFFITAWKSDGYYHADEHYQLIEFAGKILGTHQPEELAWEYNARLRPALQPTIAAFFLASSNAIQLKDPYRQLFILRLLSALLTIVVTSFFVRSWQNEVSGLARGWLYGFSFLLWFIPFLGVRFSAETYSGLSLLGALAISRKGLNSKKTAIAFGVVLGFGFLFRYQMAFAAAALLLWLLFIARTRAIRLLQAGAAFLVVLLFGLILDSWFYGAITFVPFNYAKAVIDSGGSGFGTDPWYFYFVKLSTYSGLMIGIPLIISLLLILLFDVRNPVLWVFLSFVLIHMVIPHKEERFLFPVAFLIPYFLLKAYAIIRGKWGDRPGVKPTLRMIALVIVLTNIPALLVMATKPAGLGRTAITKYIHQTYENKAVKLVFCTWSNPYNPWQSLPLKFYLEPDIQFGQVKNLCALNDTLIDPNRINLLVCRKADLLHTACGKQPEAAGYIQKAESVSDWVLWLNSFYKGLDDKEILYLYEKQTSKPSLGH